MVRDWSLVRTEKSSIASAANGNKRRLVKTGLTDTTLQLDSIDASLYLKDRAITTIKEPMFATLRAEDRKGEVVCISTSDLPPQAGQNTVHFACDGCRSKKLKCTGQKFGCQRCRDRNLTCIYSDTLHAKRQRSRKVPGKSSVFRHIQPSHSPLASPGITTASLPQKHVDTSASISQPAKRLKVSTELPTLAHHEASLSLSSGSSGEESALPTPTNFGASNGINDGYFGTFDGDLIDPFLLDTSPVCTGNSNDIPVPTPAVSSKVDSSDGAWPSDSCTNPFLPDLTDGFSLERISEPFTPHSTISQTTCKCFAQTLRLLENVHSQDKIVNLRIAEQALCLLKQLISQCRNFAYCANCRSSHRLFTFLIMLIEKMTGLLEQVAAAWEESNHTERFSSWTNVNSLYSSDGAPVLMGGYTIDNHQERSDLFGFLIFAQARRVAFLCDTVAHRAEEERWKSQQIALLPVALRVRELQDTLGGSIDLHTA